ncbi:glycoside hydrolase family 97 protein [Flavivirga algicola]|uniref:Glycoside hydrolase family 97 protein n=1 Tax=Flavivirga algicola TaxID=2729136 RepID=A0ABX1RTF0_9FLAO|nr:glycoside hydrolase family 97 protein [Flavivirga algicola]NMH86834.1 glycoside hydrolase family 97 protein [Flavivirga algicola]
MMAIVLMSCSKTEEKFVLNHGKNEVQIFKTNNGALAYQITSSGTTVIDSSSLGITINNNILGRHSNIKLIDEQPFLTKFPLLGVKSKAEYKAKVATFQLTEISGLIWYIDIQVSDEGVAYRYRVPGTETQTVNGEETAFKIPSNTKVWFFERNSDWKLKSHAGEWLSADISKMPKISKMGPTQGLTLTLELPQGGYAQLAEAALWNYSGMRLEAIGDNTFRANFTEGGKGFEIEGDIKSPWRCILLADNLNDLVNNTMVPALNPEPDNTLFADRSWIKPGTSVWHWWTKKEATPEDENQMVDDAIALGLDYSMVDEGWEKWDNKWETTTKLCNYANKNNIGIFLWKRSKEINFPKNDWEVMRYFLDSVKMTGAKGVKVDFMNGQTKKLIDFDENLLKKAAERQLMVNFHGCQQSSGEYRTYPNEVTREGVRGLEVNGMKEGMLTASHNAALPFTRLVTGHADYTPIGFTNPGETTWAHQLATLVCFYSPFQCLAEGTDFLQESQYVKPALSFIDEVPSVWDETIVLPESKIGDLAIIVRRKDKDWYLGVLNAGDTRTIHVNCDFLSENSYTTEVFTDDLEADKFDISGLHPRQFFKEFNKVTLFKKETTKANKTSDLKIDLAQNGGAVVWFKSN